ncbi:MAG: O-methyltransferase [Nitrospinota bacterium]
MPTDTTATSSIQSLFEAAIRTYAEEADTLRFLPENRYNCAIFPATGQYDWFSGQLLYCLIRYRRPMRIIEISTSSGYSTLFMALALRKNGFGRVHTFEIDASVAYAAMKNFERYHVKTYVDVHIGDARTNIKRVEGITRSEMLFLDSVHTETFARWFIETLVTKARKEALFQMHDILPLEARVRHRGGPPWPLLPQVYRRTRHLLGDIVRGRPLARGRVKRIVRRADLPGTLPTYNGNSSTEAIFGNRLVSLMSRYDYCFCYDVADKYSDLLSSRKYDEMAIGRQDAEGRPFEWNESLWAYAGAVSEAYVTLRNSS